MAQRQNQVTIKSDEVQGEGSFVVFRSLTMGQTSEFMALAKDEGNGDEFAGSKATIVAAVAGWNWVDDAGKPLPLPSAGLDLNLLTEAEVIWLVDHAHARREQPGGKN